MTEITRKIIYAFAERRELRISNSYTNGDALWLFNNKIAEHRPDGIWIRNAGWFSKTTKERLNGINGVLIIQRRGSWFLNGIAWDGEWININTMSQDEGDTGLESGTNEYVEFDMTFEWKSKERYSKPVYSVFHTTSEDQLSEVEDLLKANGIKTRRTESDTEGIYRVNYFIVVLPEDHKKSLKLIV